MNDTLSPEGLAVLFGNGPGDDEQLARYALWHKPGKRRAWEVAHKARTEAECVAEMLDRREGGAWVVLPVGRRP